MIWRFTFLIISLFIHLVIFFLICLDFMISCQLIFPMAPLTMLLLKFEVFLANRSNHPIISCYFLLFCFKNLNFWMLLLIGSFTIYFFYFMFLLIFRFSHNDITNIFFTTLTTFLKLVNKWIFFHFQFFFFWILNLNIFSTFLQIICFLISFINFLFLLF